MVVVGEGGGGGGVNRGRTVTCAPGIVQFCPILTCTAVASLMDTAQQAEVGASAIVGGTRVTPCKDQCMKDEDGWWEVVGGDGGWGGVGGDGGWGWVGGDGGWGGGDGGWEGVGGDGGWEGWRWWVGMGDDGWWVGIVGRWDTRGRGHIGEGTHWEGRGGRTAHKQVCMQYIAPSQNVTPPEGCVHT